MNGKCPICGAPMGNDTCDYCGYTPKPKPKPPEEKPKPEHSSPQPQVTAHHRTNSIEAELERRGIKPYISKSSKTATLLLCFFLGWMGIHRFYVGKVFTGILYLFTFGLLGFGWAIDFLVILFGWFKDADGMYLKW